MEIWPEPAVAEAGLILPIVGVSTVPAPIAILPIPLLG
jgi:hypothetical protein